MSFCKFDKHAHTSTFPGVLTCIVLLITAPIQVSKISTSHAFVVESELALCAGGRHATYAVFLATNHMGTQRKVEKSITKMKESRQAANLLFGPCLAQACCAQDEVRICHRPPAVPLVAFLPGC